MRFHVIVFSFHLKLCTKKEGGLPWPIARKTNFISLRSAALRNIFVCNLVHAYKFYGYLKTAR